MSSAVTLACMSVFFCKWHKTKHVGCLSQFELLLRKGKTVSLRAWTLEMTEVRNVISVLYVKALFCIWKCLNFAAFLSWNVLVKRFIFSFLHHIMFVLWMFCPTPSVQTSAMLKFKSSWYFKCLTQEFKSSKLCHCLKSFNGYWSVGQQDFVKCIHDIRETVQENRK